MGGVIDPTIKGKGQARGGHFIGGTICGGGVDKIMGTAVRGGATGIVHKRG